MCTWRMPSLNRAVISSQGQDVVLHLESDVSLAHPRELGGEYDLVRRFLHVHRRDPSSAPDGGSLEGAVAQHPTETAGEVLEVHPRGDVGDAPGIPGDCHFVFSSFSRFLSMVGLRGGQLFRSSQETPPGAVLAVGTCRSHASCQHQLLCQLGTQHRLTNELGCRIGTGGKGGFRGVCQCDRVKAGTSYCPFPEPLPPGRSPRCR